MDVSPEMVRSVATALCMAEVDVRRAIESVMATGERIQAAMVVAAEQINELGEQLEAMKQPPEEATVDREWGRARSMVGRKGVQREVRQLESTYG